MEKMVPMLTFASMLLDPSRGIEDHDVAPAAAAHLHPHRLLHLLRGQQAALAPSAQAAQHDAVGVRVQALHHLALDVLRHRVIVTYEAEAEEKTSEDVIRAVLDGRLGAGDLASAELNQALAYCLSCKACRTECPSNVDLAALKDRIVLDHAPAVPRDVRNEIDTSADGFDDFKVEDTTFDF